MRLTKMKNMTGIKDVLLQISLKLFSEMRFL